MTDAPRMLDAWRIILHIVYSQRSEPHVPESMDDRADHTASRTDPAIPHIVTHKFEPNSDPTPGLTPPRFRLSTLFVTTAIVCFGLALAKNVSPALSGLTVLLLLIVLAHVAGNVVGTHLRDSSRHAKPLDESTPVPGSPLDQNVLEPPSRLGHHGRLGWGTVIMTTIGAIGGCTGGGWLLWWSMSGNASLANMALGVASCGVLGGMGGFGLSSLLSVLGGAVWQAHHDHNDR